MKSTLDNVARSYLSSEELAAQGSCADQGLRVMRSPLRHVSAQQVDAAARIESRNREVRLPPIGVYRWWARRTVAVNGAIADAFALDHPNPLLVADPFSGGGVIALAAVLRHHAVYAQDVNPWATAGLAGMLGLPEASAIVEATERLHALVSPTLDAAYRTTFSDGSAAEIAHTFRVASALCTHCGLRGRLFPHALVTLSTRRERGKPEAFLACPAGHLFMGTNHQPITCSVCGLPTDPTAEYTARRTISCWSCGTPDKLADRSAEGDWRWEVVLVERSKGRLRELALATEEEISRADTLSWSPSIQLPAIPVGQETRVLTRHGFAFWHDLYPRRQRVVIEHMLTVAAETFTDEPVLRTLRLAVIGSTEMAGLLSRWDRFYLKSYEAMAGHRFNFATFVAEPNVWGASASGRGTVRRRLASFAKSARWMSSHVGRTLNVVGPVAIKTDAVPFTGDADVCIAEGSSERLALASGSVDLVLTDPPYHDDVEYDELSLPLRAWGGMAVERLESSASVNATIDRRNGFSEYSALLSRIFAEVRRTLKKDGHLIFSYANREPAAWVAVLSALEAAGLAASGYLVVHAENETDVAKRGVRACNLDVLMDLVPQSATMQLEQWKPMARRPGAEEEFVSIVGDAFLQVGSLPVGWEHVLTRRLRQTRFLTGVGRRSGSRSAVTQQTRPVTRMGYP